jgi:hypothetical protein
LYIERVFKKYKNVVGNLFEEGDRRRKLVQFVGCEWSSE